MSEHKHSHDHSHIHAPESLNKIFIFCIILNLLFVAIEAGVGLWINSLSLLSDAGHNLSDVFSLTLALFAFRMAKKPATARFTYGYKKSTVLISLVNAVILLIAVGAIIVESIYKFDNQEEISGAAISWTAGIGIVINGLTTLLLMKNQKHDLNVKGAYLHMAMDTLVSVGVVISGLIIMFTGWVIVDAIVSIIIAIIILVSTWNLLKESIFLSLDAVPAAIDGAKIEEQIKRIDGVAGVHHIHIWAMSTTENAATMHIRIADLARMEEVKLNVKSIMNQNNVRHTTIEFELYERECSESNC